jgi:dTDP-4-amino-4,6-dideoxygalactose transaminase
MQSGSMKIVQAPRASAILYNLLVSQTQTKPWLMPANICPIVPITFMKARVPFEFVDISPATLHMDLDHARALIEKRGVGGLLYAHTYGEESTPDDFFEHAKSIDPEFLIVDDRCLCIPAFEVTTYADVVLFSTGYAKIVEFETGGYALMGDDVPYQPARLSFSFAAHHELEATYKAVIRDRSRFEYHDTDWLMTDFDMPAWDEYRVQIEAGLGKSLAQRTMLNAIYSSRLPEEVQLPSQYQTWRFNIRVKNKTQILKAIFDQGLFASSHYASLAGIMSESRAPAAEALAEDVINLFNDHHYTTEMAERLCDIVLKAL